MLMVWGKAESGKVEIAEFYTSWYTDANTVPKGHL